MKSIKVPLLPAVITVAALALSGCSNMMVPKTTLTIPLPNGQTASYSGPKNTSLEGLELQVGTNGVATLKISKATTTMDPQVISMSSAAFNSAINTIGQNALAVAKMAMAASNTNLLLNTNFLSALPPQ